MARKPKHGPTAVFRLSEILRLASYEASQVNRAIWDRRTDATPEKLAELDDYDMEVCERIRKQVLAELAQ